MTPIEPGVTYEYGVITRDSEGRADTDAPVYPRNSQWPKQYPGSHFIENMNVRTFEEYLQVNPEGLATNRIVHFFAMDKNGDKRRVASGTPMAQQPGSIATNNNPVTQQQQATYPTVAPFNGVPAVIGLQDAVRNVPVHQGDHFNDEWRRNEGVVDHRQRPMNRAYPDSGNDRMSVIEMREKMVDLNQRLSESEMTAQRLRAELDQLRSETMDKERQVIEARAQLQIQEERHKAREQNLIESHQSAMNAKEAEHRHATTISDMKAVEIAKQQLSEGLSDPAENVMEKISAFMPVIEPLMPPLMRLVEAWTERYITKISPANAQTNVAAAQSMPANGQVAQPATAMPTSMMPDGFGADEFVPGGV